MVVTRLSSKGQVVLPKAVRDAHGWREGMEFVVEVTPAGLLLRPRKPFAARTFAEVLGCLRHRGPPLTPEQMDAALRGRFRRERG
jgi:AbrB family looped-hinge helix DNA binding protein